MRFTVLGPLTVAHDRVPARLTGMLQRRLVAALLVQANTVVSADRLVHVLWAEDVPAAARQRNLHTQVWRLRAALDECARGGSAALVTEPPGYLLRVDADSLDAARFERIVIQAVAEPERPDRVATRLGEALELWRGAAFAEFAGEEFCRYEAMRLEELRLVAKEEWFEACLAMGRHTDLIGDIDAFVAEHPLRERPRGLQMVALYRAGRQADALAVYRVFRDQLVDQLGLEPSPALRQRHQRILRGDASLDRAAAQPRQTTVVHEPPRRDPVGNLRLELSALVGRTADVDVALATLTRHRVVTMTGVGGVGKTRLALRVAANAQTDFPHGVWVCELAAVRHGWLVPDVLATTLGVQEPQGLSVTDALVEFLRSRRALLVIDNCEHVLEAAASLVDELARGCPEVTVLATSREPLGVDGEQVLPVQPLALPSATDPLTPARAAAVPSVALFVDRATAATATFTLGEHNVTGIVEICRRLDGLPLAIELAATRLRSMSVHEIAGRLERRLHFLHSTRRVRETRHSTLGTVVDWSYHLLEPPERQVFDRLSVLVGAFTLDDAVAIAGDEETEPAEVVDAVTGLVHKSMLVADTDGSPSRFTMLETLRIYGRERLERTRQIAAARRRHLSYCLHVAESTVAGLIGPDEAHCAERIHQMLDDLRSAHIWALANEPATALRISAALLRYTWSHGPSELYSWAERAVAAAGDETDGQGLAEALAVAAAGAARRGDLTGATEFALRGLRIVPDRDDPRRRYPLWVLARVASFKGRLTEAAHLYATVARLAGAVGDTQCVAYVTASGALQHAYRGAEPPAIRLARRAKHLAAETRNPTATAWADYALGVVLQDHEPMRAFNLLEQAYLVASAGGNTYVPGVALSIATGILTRHSDPRQAAQFAAEVIGYWCRESHWAQQWVALCNAIDLLIRLGEDEAAATIRGALLASKTAVEPVGVEAARLQANAVELGRRLGPVRLAEATDRGAAMSDATAVAFATATLDRINGQGSPGLGPILSLARWPAMCVGRCTGSHGSAESDPRAI